jgi:hypothetical protein
VPDLPIRAFWAAWNSEFCAKNCANVIIEYVTYASHIAQGFASHFVITFMFMLLM